MERVFSDFICLREGYSVFEMQNVTATDHFAFPLYALLKAPSVNNSLVVAELQHFASPVVFCDDGLPVQ